MDFSFSQEQNLLRDSVSKFLKDNYSFETFKTVARSEAGWRHDVWKGFAELGLMAAPFPESYDGLGGGPVEVMVVMEEFGRALVVEPFVATVVVAGNILMQGGNEAQKREWLPRIAGGEAVFAFAFAEPQSRFNLADVATSAKRSGANYILNGRKTVVLGGPWADALIVTARMAGGQRDRDGIGVFLVGRNLTGIVTRDYATVDGLRASELSFENVEVPASSLIGSADAGLALVEYASDTAIAAHAAEAVGAMKVLLDTTVEYSKTRRQFGAPIGSFQALQHRMVDMFMQYEQSLSMAYMATLRLGGPEAERKRAVSAAKVQIGKAGRFVGQNAVQIHGGMGMTEELNVGHYLKRLAMLDTLYGNVDHHLQRYASLG